MDYFEERSEQMSVDSMMAFGIFIQTRYAKAWQMAEMLRFTECLARKRLHTYLTRVFYDSKCDMCDFEFSKGALSAANASAILACAQKSISQFTWDGVVCHGDPLELRYPTQEAIEQDGLDNPEESDGTLSCPDCGGTGRRDGDECRLCVGYGYIQKP